MRVEIFSLCDAATVDSGGKLNVLGAFDSIWAAQMPLVYPQLAVAVRARFEKSERGTHSVVLNIVDADGKHVLPSVNGTVEIGAFDESSSTSTSLVLRLQMLKFERYGEYLADLMIDGRREASLPLFLRPRQP